MLRKKRRQIVRISNFTRGSSQSSRNETSFRKEIIIQGKRFFSPFFLPFIIIIFVSIICTRLNLCSACEQLKMNKEREQSPLKTATFDQEILTIAFVGAPPSWSRDSVRWPTGWHISQVAVWAIHSTPNRHVVKHRWWLQRPLLKRVVERLIFLKITTQGTH